MKTRKISLTVNGKSTGEHEVPEALPMVDFLHDYLELTGSKFGCGIGECHACVVVVDEADGSSRTERTCITGAAAFDGARIRTIEGYAEGETLSPLQQAFLDHFSFQCGYCTSGFLNEAQVLIERLEKNPVAKADVEATVLDAMNGHICRCSGYVRYYQAIRDYILATPSLLKAEG